MLWDARTNLATQTLNAHQNAVNHAVFNTAGDRVASVDADGVVALWDVRTCSRLAVANVGGGAGNRVAFDPSGQTCVLAAGPGPKPVTEYWFDKVDNKLDSQWLCTDCVDWLLWKR